MSGRNNGRRKDFPSRLSLRRFLHAVLCVSMYPSSTLSGERQPGRQLFENLSTLMRFKVAPSGNLLGFSAATPAKSADHIDFAYADTGALDSRFETFVGFNRHLGDISAQ